MLRLHFQAPPFLFTQNVDFVWFNTHDWLLFFGNADFIKTHIFLHIFYGLHSKDKSNHQIKSSEMWHRFLINLHLMLVVDQKEEKANSSSDWGSTLQSSHHPPVSLSHSIIAPVSPSWPVFGLWLEQTRASCGTETSSRSGIPLSVCLPTLWETWPNWWTWLLMTTRPTSAPARSISSECVI